MLTFTIIILIISGCATGVKQVDLNISEIEKPDLILPSADELNLRDIEWHIITSDNQEEVFNEIVEVGNLPVLFGITGDDYKDLSLNISDIRTYIRQQQYIIEAYKRYYQESDQIFDKANQNIQKAYIQIGELNEGK